MRYVWLIGALFCSMLFVVTPAAVAAPPNFERYIVVLHEGSGPPEDVAAELAQKAGGKVGFVYENALAGFSIELPPQALNGIQNDPRVKYIETDDPVQIFAQSNPTGIQRTFALGNASLDIDGVDDWRVDVDVAVIDTGVDFQHPDLSVVTDISANCTYLIGGGPPWARSAKCVGGEGDDDHYHGTHVAGTIGALDNGDGVVGVAPGARLISVKVLDSSGSGYESNIVAGIDWVTARSNVIDVANMSLGGAGHSQSEQDAIQAAVEAGVVFVVAAGNDDDNAANYSPAGFPNVITVSALADFDGVPGGSGSPTCRTDQDDTLADFSNWGSAVEIAAPGVCILSTYPVEQGSYGTISGTSMASPHVAGAAALLASTGTYAKNATGVQDITEQILNTGNSEWTGDSKDGVKEPLLDVSTFVPTLIPGGGDGGGNTPPTASFTVDCTLLACTFDATGSTDDGTVVGYAWTFGDGNNGSGATASHEYVAPGSYTVELTVTDDENATGTSTQPVTVSDSASSITLDVAPYKFKGNKTADLTWSGASSDQVDIRRDDAIIATVANDSGTNNTYKDESAGKGGGTHTYQVCETGTSICSAKVAVTY